MSSTQEQLQFILDDLKADLNKAILAMKNLPSQQGVGILIEMVGEDVENVLDSPAFYMKVSEFCDLFEDDSHE